MIHVEPDSLKFGCRSATLVSPVCDDGIAAYNSDFVIREILSALMDLTRDKMMSLHH